jgi:hypothetical protein
MGGVCESKKIRNHEQIYALEVLGLRPNHPLPGWLAAGENSTGATVRCNYQRLALGRVGEVDLSTT